MIAILLAIAGLTLLLLDERRAGASLRPRPDFTHAHAQDYGSLASHSPV